MNGNCGAGEGSGAGRANVEFRTRTSAAIIDKIIFIEFILNSLTVVFLLGSLYRLSGGEIASWRIYKAVQLTHFVIIYKLRCRSPEFSSL